MKKNITTRQSPRLARNARRQPMTIGLDLGDKTSRYCALDPQGAVMGEGGVATTKKAMTEKFGGLGRTRIAMEVGTHSPWVSRLLSSLGHEVIVANARQVRLISESTRKDDKLDARMLARLARIDPELLRPIRHRSEKAQEHLLAIRVRATLVDARTGLVNAARGFAKASGERLPAVDADALGVETIGALPAGLQQRLRPLLEQIESLTVKIKEADQTLEQIARIEYPETKLLRQISGVGVLIALTFVLTVEDPARFEKSRGIALCGRLLCGSAAEAQRVGPEPARAAHHQGRRSVFAKNAGAGCASCAGMAWPRYRPPALGIKTGSTRRQESEKASGGGGGQKAGDPAAPLVGDGGSVPAAAPLADGCIKFGRSQRPSSGDCAVAAERATPATETIQFGTGDGSTRFKNEDTNLAPERDSIKSANGSKACRAEGRKKPSL